MAARVGGDAFRVSGRRFGLLAPGADVTLTTDTAQRLESELQTAFAGSEIQVAVGTGIWGPGDEGEAVISRATLGADLVVGAVQNSAAGP